MTREPGFSVQVSSDPVVELVAERLRDGRVALGARTRMPDGQWEPGELHLLDRSVQLALSSWLAPAVEAAWLDTVRNRQDAPVRTAGELYGEGPGAVTRFAFEVMQEIPPDLLARAMILLANAIGPDARGRLVERLNQTENRSEDLELRRRLADENETFGYAVAAAALLDAAASGIFPEDLQDADEQKEQV